MDKQIVTPALCNRLRIKYILTDVVCTVFSWVSVNFVRHNFFGIYTSPDDPNYWFFLVFYLLGWLSLYTLAGCYNHPHHHSRMGDLIASLSTSVVGCVLLLFVMILNDTVNGYQDYIETFFVLFLIQFSFSFFPRMFITLGTLSKFERRSLIFPTLLVGDGKKVHEVDEAIDEHHSNGMYVEGRVDVRSVSDFPELVEKIKTLRIKNVIIAPDDNKMELVRLLMPTLFQCQVNIYLYADSYEMAIGRMSALDIYAVPLISLSRASMPQWQRNVKWMLDKVMATLAIVFLSPLLLFTAYKIKKGSPGPIIYRQNRVGLKGNEFQIYKFRSMYVSNDKEHSYHLTGDSDPRIVGKWGHLMRKYRIDELPQFFNVLKGDMSLVGFRPEQPYFVQQLIEHDPHYAMLYCMRPGITSWGMVKYGYAENVEQMLRRAQYDYLYIDNGSLAVDVKIIFYTIKTIFTGKGK